jgi:hypothetical protein
MEIAREFDLAGSRRFNGDVGAHGSRHAAASTVSRRHARIVIAGPNWQFRSPTAIRYGSACSRHQAARRTASSPC